MSGRDIRLQKLFSNGGKTVIIAADHSLFNGTYPGIEDLAGAFKGFFPSIDGILISPGMLKNVKDMFNYKGAPVPIARIAWDSSHCTRLKYEKSYTVSIFTAKDVVALGAEIVMISLGLKSGDEKTDSDNIEMFARLSNECREYGIPVIGECYPRHSDSLSDEDMHEHVLMGVRVMAELGADAIKTFYTYKFHEVTKNCPIPILGLGGRLTPNAVDSLILAQKMMRNGCSGVVFGRNAFQRPNPAAYQEALCEVVKHDADPYEAAKKYRL